MSRIEKILIGIISLGWVSRIMAFILGTDYIELAGISMLSLTMLIAHYLYQLGWSRYTLILLFIKFGLVRLVFQYQHYPHWGPIDLLGHLFLLVFAATLALERVKLKKGFAFHLLAFFFALQATIYMVRTPEMSQLSTIGYVPTILIIAYIKIRRESMNYGIDKMLNVALIHGSLLCSWWIVWTYFGN